MSSKDSDSTIELVPFDKVLEALETAADDVKQSKDYLSYSTVLDIYYTDPARYTFEEREELLGNLQKVLASDSELTYEIGWDLPSLLIPFVDTDYDFSGVIRKAPGVYKILKIFEILAHNGNPKELFLKCTELLQTIRLNDNKFFEPNNVIQDQFFDLKLYCIFELSDSCLKKINTYYPSRFLAMLVTSYINLLYMNVNHSVSNNSFMLKRVYNFSRNYTSPKFPTSSNKDYTKEELDKITDDENYLQRKLLTGFITEALLMSSRKCLSGYSVSVLSHLQESSRLTKSENESFVVDHPVLDRLYELLLSFDIDIDDVFKNFLVDSHKLFLDVDHNQDGDEISGEIFEKLIIDYQENLVSTLVNSDSNQIRNSTLGIIYLFTYSIASKQKFNIFDLDFTDALVMTIRIIVPAMVQSTFNYLGLHDIMVYWGWFSIHKLTIRGKRLELELSKIPKILLTIYYQTLLFMIISNPNSPNFRFATLTLLTRVLALSPEDIAYSFLLDSLQNCPFDNVKIVLVGVLKELLTKDKDRQIINDISDSLAKVDLQKKVDSGETSKEKIDEEVNSKPRPPILPSRQGSNSGPIKSKFISLSEERADDITALIEDSNKKVFQSEGNDDEKIQLNLFKLPTLSAFLNLLVILKDDPRIPNESVQEIVKNVDQNVRLVEKILESDESKIHELNAIRVLKVTLDRIRA